MTGLSLLIEGASEHWPFFEVNLVVHLRYAFRQFRIEIMQSDPMFRLFAQLARQIQRIGCFVRTAIEEMLSPPSPKTSPDTQT